MTRPPIEDLDRLHGEASDVTVALRYPPTTRQWGALTACREIASSWPQISEYIRGLESALKVCRRALKNDPYRWYLQEIASADAALGDTDD